MMPFVLHLLLGSLKLKSLKFIREAILWIDVLLILLCWGPDPGILVLWFWNWFKVWGQLYPLCSNIQYIHELLTLHNYSWHRHIHSNSIHQSTNKGIFVPTHCLSSLPQLLLQFIVGHAQTSASVSYVKMVASATALASFRCIFALLLKMFWFLYSSVLQLAMT